MTTTDSPAPAGSPAATAAVLAGTWMISSDSHIIEKPSATGGTSTGPRQSLDRFDVPTAVA